MHRTARALLLLFPLLALSCSTAAGLRRAELRRNLDQARLSRTPAEIWPELLRFLHERGYPLVGEDPAVLGLPTQGTLGKLFSPGHETRVRTDGSRILETNVELRSRTRVRAEALAVPGGGSSLRIVVLQQADMSPSEFTEGRDEELEVAILERLDPVIAAQVQGIAAPQAAAATAGRDGWAAVRHLVGTWTGTGPGGAAVRWRFDFASDAQYLEVRGTPLLFAGPVARPGQHEELGRISRDGTGKLTWRQFTAGGRVDQYQPDPGRPEALVFVATAPESLPGGRIRLTLGRDGDEEILAILELAEPGKDFAVAGEVRLKRSK
ncbi:MAG: hypothetical protein HZB56_12885 [Deltaproteobacteria bacterium]|nr:hypothetical protein [Deltaproteobacteria bacterium]